MSKQLTNEEVMNAKAIICFNNEVIYVEPKEGDDVYGFSRNSLSWFLKENYWDYYESELMLSYMVRLSAHEALRMIHYWKKNSVEQRNAKLDKAICFAVEHHAGQLRKGTNIPYITHPLEVMSILMRMNADIELQIAGVLHDTVEDTDATAEEISELFGTDVAELVAHHSENKSLSWFERKSYAITSLKAADKRLKMLVMADKLSNLRSIAADYRKLGDELWKRFNAPMEKQSWYYSGVQDALWDMQLYEDTADAYWEMVGLYKDVFVKFYRSHPCPGYSDEYLLQMPVHGGVFRLDKGNPQWYEVNPKDLDDAEYHEVGRKELEETEDRWNEPFWECVEVDLRASEFALASGRNRRVEIKVLDGKLALSGEEWGPACERINGKDEYEYRVSFDEDNTKRLLTQLRMEYGTEMPLAEMLREAFGTEMPSTKLMEYCEAREVEYSFSSY